MANKMLIDATHPEETRVVVLRGNRVEEFDFESAQRQQLRGNIYLAKVTRVEPSLQAAFVDYGGNRHGFLAFSEIHPDYYQIPVADRQALLDEERRAHRAADDEDERRARRHKLRSAAAETESVKSETVEEAGEAAAEDRAAEGAPAPDHALESAPPVSEAETPDAAADQAAGETSAPAEAIEQTGTAHATPLAELPVPSDDAPPAQPEAAAAEGERGENGEGGANGDGGDIEEVDAEEADEVVESVGGADAMEEMPERAPRLRRQYKIQEVIKRRQIMLVQVVKEERGTKGAALTTYLSLAGRYSVLMPNTARGGGISRKITNAQDRKRLKEVAHELEVPEGMGVILRTAGANRTKTEIKRDFEYLLRMWEQVRDLTLQSTAPKLVYEEGSLIKRAIRDLYSKEIDEIAVAGDNAYKEAKDFMRMLMPSHAKNVKPFRDTQPIFTRHGIESQLDAMFSPVVQLRSGGYIVLNQAEALVAIDVNSGRATREHHIEDTALKTNLEAAEEVSRQLRLRDLAGLIVIDFIDMDEKRNNRAVERRLKECLRHDRARIQVGRISHFGLLEMSRQRIRSSVLESSTEKCPHCGGTGHVRSVASVALQLVRSLEETLQKGATHNMIVRTRAEVAIYVLNHKRAHLRDLEDRFKITLVIQADETVGGALPFAIERGEQVHSAEAARALALQVVPLAAAEEEEEETVPEEEADQEETERESSAEEGEAEETGEGEERADGEGARRRRRRRRRGRREEPAPSEASGEGEESEEPEAEGSDQAAADSGEPGEPSEGGESRRDGDRRRRRRGRRGGRRRERDEHGVEVSPVLESEVIEAVTDLDIAPPRHEPAPVEAESAAPPAPEPAPAPEAAPAQAEPPKRRSTVREPAPVFAVADAAAPSPSSPAPVSAPVVAPEAPGGDMQTQAPKSGWWKRKIFGGES